MIKVKTAALALVILSAAAPAFAADAMMAKPMSAKDTKMMKSCMAMSEPMRMKDKGCMAMMKAHPNMGKSDKMSGGMMKDGSASGGTMSGSMAK